MFLLYILIFAACGGAMFSALCGLGGLLIILWYMFVVGIPLTIGIVACVLAAPFLGVAGLLMLLMGCFVSVMALLQFLTAKATGRNASLTGKELRGILVLGGLAAGLWYYLPAEPVQVAPEEVACIRLYAPDAAQDLYFRSEAGILNDMETLQGFSLHRTLRTLTPQEVQENGAFLELQDAQGRVICTYQICQAEYFGVAEDGRATQYYKSYSIVGKKLNLGGLSAASRVEGRRRNDAFNASIRQFIETIQVENNTVTFTVPEQWQQDYAAWQVDPVTATCADGTTVTLTGKIRSGSWQPGEEYSFQLEEPVTSLVFPIWFEGYQYCPDLVELLPAAYQIQTEETAA